VEESETIRATTFAPGDAFLLKVEFGVAGTTLAERTRGSRGGKAPITVLAVWRGVEAGKAMVVRRRWSLKKNQEYWEMRISSTNTGPQRAPERPRGHCALEIKARRT